VAHAGADGRTAVTLILGHDDVSRAMNVDAAFAACEYSYRELAAGRAVNRPTSQSYLPHRLPRSTYNFKSVDGGVGALGVMALRLTSEVIREEEASGTLRLNKVPLANGQFTGLVMLFSIDTGEPLAIMPDGVIQQVRVAITSALGVKYLARDDSTTLGLIGTGDQARAHLRMFSKVRRFSRVKVYSPHAEHRRTFVETMAREGGASLIEAASVRDAIDDCDVVCTATNASRPIVSAELLRPGMHYNAIREFEVSEDVFARADRVVIHTRFGGAHHYLPAGVRGDLPGVRREQPRDWSVYPEIGDVIAGTAPGRTRREDVTFFLNNIGTGMQFAAVGSTVLARSRELGLGREVPTEWFLQPVKP
jgi:ornithine cyclodeaminase/alanine dehydrogenase-like protein (mu-crystallin family)